MLDASEQIKQAITFARSGNREAALQLLVDSVEQDPHNPTAWVLLSHLVNNEEDRLVALDNALALLPGDEKLIARREALLHANPLLAESIKPKASPMDELERGRALLASGQSFEALEVFHAIAQKTPEETPAWIELARLEPALSKRILAAEKVVALNPEDPAARALLNELQLEQKNPLLRGRHLEEQGDYERAVSLYTTVIALSRLPAERLEAERRIDTIKLRHESHEAQPVHPNVNLARMAVGPVIMFLLMLFIQSGLKVTHFSLLSIPGILFVTAGSLLVAITEMIPAHPRWVSWFGQPGSGDEPQIRRELRWLGWALMLAPFVIFLLEAGRRLVDFQDVILSGF